MPRRWPALLWTLWLGGLGAAPALASTLPRRPDLAYMTLERPRNSLDPESYQIFLGAAPLSRERFVQTLEAQGPDFALVRRLHAEQTVRSGMLWGGLLLLVAAPVVGATYWTNNSRNPAGVITRTWLGVTIGDTLAAVTLLGLYWFRKDAPYYNYEQAQDAARAYNERVEGHTAPGAY